MAKLFFSYSHADEGLRDQLEKHLTMLKRQGLIETWHDRRITAGENFSAAIDKNLEEADIILLLVSTDFLASEYCYEREMSRAIERDAKGLARVIPVILRPCDWKDATPFKDLLAAPTDGKPITQWPDLDSAFLNVTQMVKAALAQRNGKPSAPPSKREPMSFFESAENNNTALARSSNLRLKKEFSERDKDRFRHETFEFVAKFFEGSLAELSARNEGIEGDFRRVDANRFTAAIYRSGKAEARCTIFMGGMFGAGGISFVFGETMETNSTNESLSVKSDDQMLYLQALGLARLGSNRDSKLSQEGAAEFLWSLLIERLQ